MNINYGRWRIKLKFTIVLKLIIKCNLTNLTGLKESPTNSRTPHFYLVNQVVSILSFKMRVLLVLAIVIIQINSQVFVPSQVYHYKWTIMHRFDLFRTLDDFDGEYVVWLWPSVVSEDGLIYFIN